MIAGKLGVEVDDLPSQNPDELGNAIKEVERDNAERINLESQRETSRLLLAPLEAKQPTWTCAWLPAWQWFLLLAWFWRIVLAPTVNGALNANVELVPLSDLAWITTVYMGLHMGGRRGGGNDRFARPGDENADCQKWSIILVFSLVGAIMQRDMNWTGRMITFSIGVAAAVVFAEPARLMLSLDAGWSDALSAVLAMIGRNLSRVIVRH